jgi:hypothetical protein
VSAFRAGERDWLEQGFGLWTRYGHGIDGADYEQSIRAQWSRKCGSSSDTGQEDA